MESVSAFIISAEDGLTNQSFRLDNIVWKCESSCKNEQRGNLDTDISGVWRNANKTNAMGVGPFEGNTEYWRIDDFELDRRSCQFDDTYTFTNNDTLQPGGGSFEQDMQGCLLYTSPSPRDGLLSRMPSSA